MTIRQQLAAFGFFAAFMLAWSFIIGVIVVGILWPEAR